MTHYPLIFTLRDVVSGNGFLAGVTLTGRALMVKEDENEWWVYGVRPGALAEVGTTPQEAYLKFRNTYKNVLFDIAAEAASFDAFKGEVEQFYYQPDEHEERRWQEALDELRRGECQPEAPFTELPRVQAETRPTHMSVERLDVGTPRFTATDNVPDLYVAAVA